MDACDKYRLFPNKLMIDNVFCIHDYYSVSELSQLLGIRTSFVAALRRTGRIPEEAIRVHKLKRWFSCEMIDKLLDDGSLHIEDEELDEPAPERLIKHENLELLPIHYERYLHFYHLRKRMRPLDYNPNSPTN